MARRKGIVNVSTDYEVKIKAPFDARQLCNTKDDLIDEASWSYASTYVGMLVSIANDPVADNNGVYFLKIDTPTDESSWVKLFDTEEFEAFQEKLAQDLNNYVTSDQLSGYAKIYFGERPEVGDSNTIYFNEVDGNIEEWIWYNDKYVIVGSSSSGDLTKFYTKAEVDELINGVVSRIPTSLSQLSNAETGFITAAVDNLVNYYKKSEVNDLIGQLSTLSFEVVDSLPETGDTNKIYLVPKTQGQPQNGYDEYIFINETWEKIGSTDIDLSQYATQDFVIQQVTSATQGMATIDYVSEQLTQALQEYVTTDTFTSSLAGKQDLLVSGTNVKTINGYSILGEGNIQIQGGSGGDISIATEDTVGGILATDNSSVEGVEAFVDVDDTGKASVKIPSVDETSTPDDVVNLLNTSTLILNGNA